MQLVSGHRDASKIGASGDRCQASRCAAARSRPTRCPPAEAGDIYLRSPSNAAGYWNAPQETAATFVDGCVFQHHPRDVEDAVTEHPAIAVAAVLGVPTSASTGRSSPSCAPDGDADIELRGVGARAHGAPREIRVVDSIPLTPVPEVDRTSLTYAR